MTAVPSTSHLGLPAASLQLDLGRAEAPDLLVGDLEGLEHRLLVDLLGARLDHRDGLVGARDDEVELGLLALLQGRVDDELVPDQADADRAHRALEGQLREHQRGRGPVDAEDVERVHLVDREHRRDHLGLVAVALGPERPDRPVGHARRQGRAVARPRLALDETAGDLPGGVHPLLHVHREGEEVRPRARLLRAHRRHQHHRVARSDDDGPVRLLGELARLELDRHIADLDGHRLYCHFTSLVCPAPRRSASMCPRRPAPALCLVVPRSRAGRATCAGPVAA